MKTFLLTIVLLTMLSLSSCAFIVYDDDDGYDDDSDSVTIIFHQSPSPVDTDR